MLKLQYFWLSVAFLSVQMIENKTMGFQAQKGFKIKAQFNCSDSASLKKSNTSRYLDNNRTFYQFSKQYWPRRLQEVKPTTYHVPDLRKYTSNRPAPERQRIVKIRVCKILRTAVIKTPAQWLRIYVLNTTHVFIKWIRVKAPPGAKITYSTFMKRGSDGIQHIELLCHSNRTSCIVKKDSLPKNFDVFVNVNAKAGPKLQIRFGEIGWNFIKLDWNSVSRYYGNVTYSVLYFANNGGNKFTTNQEEVTLNNLQQFTTYSIRVQAAVKNDKVVVASKWLVVKTLDFDECEANNHGCGPQDWCVNTEGSYFCKSCSTGYTRNGHNCTDYDECTTNNSKCDANAECINTPGSYSCRCDDNYTGNGYNCTRIVLKKCSDMKQMSRWDDPDFSHCINKEIVKIYDELRKDSADPLAVAKQLAHFISLNQSGPLYASDLNLVINSLDILLSEDVLERLGGGKTGLNEDIKVHDYAMSVLNISNGILDKRLLPSWKQVPKGYAATLANKIIESNNKVALLLSKNNTKEIYAERDNVVLSARGIPVDGDVSDQLLPPTRGMREGSVYVPASVIRHQKSSKGMRYLSFVSYNTINEVLQTEQGDQFTVLPLLISVTLTPLDKNQFDHPVGITIKRTENDVAGEPTCGFLNVSKSDDISWSTEGCEVGSSNETHVECLCYHLTSFAILMQIKDVDAEAIEKEHYFALSLISYIGLCSSIVALFIVFLTFAFIRFLKLPRHFIHANLALSLALAHTTFLFGINRTETKILCKALAIALHYLFQVAFTWMALEGVVLYLMLVKVFHSSMSGKKTKLIFFFCGWGFPAVIVALSSSIYHDGYGTNKFCWLSLDREFIWAFVAPVLAVIAFNFLCLGGTFYVMAKRGSNSNSVNKVEKIRYWARSCCLLTCILGVTWLLGIFFVNKHSLFMAYLFSILNAFQGLAIFLLHCIGDRKIRTAYINILRCNPAPYTSSSGGAKLLYKQSLPSRSGSARDPPSNERTSNELKRVKAQEATASLIKGPDVLKQVEVRISDELTPMPYASAYGDKRLSRSKADSFLEASTPLISDSNSGSFTQMKLNQQWI